MEAAVKLMRDVFMWEDDRLLEPFGRAAVGSVAAALDAFAAESLPNVKLVAERDEARAEEEWFREQVTKLFAPWTTEWITAHPDQPHVHPGLDTLIAWKVSLILHGAEMAIGRHLEGEAAEAALRERNRALVAALQVIFRRGYHGASYVAQLALAADAKAGEDA